MLTGNPSSDLDRFNIILIKLEEATAAQEENLKSDLIAAGEVNKTLSLFKEFQESIAESTYTTFTKS